MLFGFILEGRPAHGDIDPDEVSLLGFRLIEPDGPDPAQTQAELRKEVKRMHLTTLRLDSDGTLTEVPPAGRWPLAAGRWPRLRPVPS
ncbi:hypothetical protein [Streptomyces sp. NPDC051364]|uniref:hypothetical protein n=1 Tax=Streptomyces sp. NPDC051364 TaxID=3155799 RepID=UPI003445C138